MGLIRRLHQNILGFNIQVYKLLLHDAWVTTKVIVIQPLRLESRNCTSALLPN